MAFVSRYGGMSPSEAAEYDLRWLNAYAEEISSFLEEENRPKKV